MTVIVKHKMKIWDEAKVVFASATGLGIQLSDVEIVVRIGVGLATIVYIVYRTILLRRNKKDPEL